VCKSKSDKLCLEETHDEQKSKEQKYQDHSASP
jgi:hypothetical protein